jgi:hypothetical protein
MQNELKFECQMPALNPKSGLGSISRVATAGRRPRNAAGFENDPRTEAGGTRKTQESWKQSQESTENKGVDFLRMRE